MTRFARTGHDEDFGRGSPGWDPGRNGDPRVGPQLLPRNDRMPAPFYAFPAAGEFSLVPRADAH